MFYNVFYLYKNATTYKSHKCIILPTLRGHQKPIRTNLQKGADFFKSFMRFRVFLVFFEFLSSFFEFFRVFFEFFSSFFSSFFRVFFELFSSFFRVFFEFFSIFFRGFFFEFFSSFFFQFFCSFFEFFPVLVISSIYIVFLPCHLHVCATKIYNFDW